MNYERLHLTFVGFIALLVDSVVVGELIGYWLHRVVYSTVFPAFNWTGYQATVRDRALDDTGLPSLSGCNTALFCKPDSRLAE